MLRRKTRSMKKKGKRPLAGHEGASAGRGGKATLKPGSKVSVKSGSEEPFVVTSVRVRPAHWRALREEALQVAGLGKRADASAVLRDILDGWLAKRR